jgi:peroxiredoxin
VSACGALATQTALARHRDRTPGTGLPAIRLAKPAPDFSFDTAAGPRKLDSFYGRPVVLNFWASFCEPCQAETDTFVTLLRTYGDAVTLVTISEDQTPGAAAAFLHAHAVDGIAIDDPDRHIFDLYTVVPIPVTLVLAPDGTVTHVSVGQIDWQELQAAVQADLTLPDAFATLRPNAGTPEP